MQFKVVFRLCITLALAVGGFSASANEFLAPITGQLCESLLATKPQATDLHSLMSAASAKIAAAKASAPDPEFVDISAEMNIKWDGIAGPKLLQDMLPADVQFFASPSPVTESPMAARLITPLESMAFRLRMPWKNGESADTDIWVSLPHPLPATKNKYLIGPEYKKAAFFIHGGGTSQATGVNGMGVAHPLAKYGIPVISVDMPGHMRGPRTIMTTNGQTRTFDEIIDWVMAIIDKLVDPQVKIAMTGHSWGGQAAVYMWMKSNEHKYQRIDSYIGLAPPVDTSNGGTPEQKVAVELEIQNNFEQLKDRLAPEDLAFARDRIVLHKSSSIAPYFTEPTFAQYSTPTMSAEEQALRPPLLVITGAGDGPVYVGREEPYKKFFGQLVAPHSFELLGNMPTRESKKPDDLFITPHGLFNVMKPGGFGESGSHFIYDRMAQWILGVEDLTPFIVSASPPPDKINQIIYDFLFNYSNYFPFRELIDRKVFESVLPNPHSNARARLSQLDKYLTAIGDLQKKLPGQITEAKTLALKALRTELNADSRLSPEAAQVEIVQVQNRLPVSTEHEQQIADRIATLEAYINQLDEAAQNFRTQPPEDSVFVTAQTALFNEYSDLNVTPQTLDSEIAATKDLKKSPRSGRLNQLAERLRHITREKEARFGQNLDLALEQVVKPEGIANFKAGKRELDQYTRIAERAKDVGIAEALKERQSLLTLFLDKLPQALENAEREAQLKSHNSMLQLSKNAQVESVEAAKIAQGNLSASVQYHYIHDNDPELTQIVNALKAKEKALSEIKEGANGTDSGLLRMEKNLRPLQEKRGNMLRRLKEIRELGNLTSPRLQKAKARLAEARIIYERDVRQAEAADSMYAAQLTARNELTKENVLNRPASIRELEKAISPAKQEYKSAERDLIKAFYSIGADAMLIGDASLVSEVQSLLWQLYGSNGLDVEIAAQEKLTAEMQTRRSLLEAEISQLHYEYVTRMNYLKEHGANDLDIPFQVTLVNIRDLLDKSLVEAQEAMKDPTVLRAAEDTLVEWKSMIHQIRSDAQLIKALQ